MRLSPPENRPLRRRAAGRPTEQDRSVVGVQPPQDVAAVLRRILPPDDMLAMDVLFGLRATRHLVDTTVQSWLSPDDVSTSRMHVLLVLWAADRPVPHMHIVRAMKFSRATVSGLVASLLDAGYVASTVDDNDRRHALLSLTKAGVESARRSMQGNANRLAEALGGLSTGELVQLVDLLARARASVAASAD